VASASAIDAGNGHACAVTSDGTNVQCWGRNGDGQLGAAANGPASAVSAGGGLDAGGVERGHTCAVRPDTTVACWGRNADGQLGDGSTTDRSGPVTVQIDTDPDPAHVTLANLTGVTQVVTGGFHSCALVNDGTVWCWGANVHGQLGDGTVVDRTVATEVQVPKPGTPDLQPLTGAVAVAAGLRSTCAVVSAAGTSQVECWGANDHGQLGDGTVLEHHLPAATAAFRASPVRAIVAGDVHVCVDLQDDSVWCWGGNSTGQVGDGTTTDSTSPEVIVPAPPAGSVADSDRPIVKSISAGRANTCIVQGTYNKVYCWGDNSRGQLSDGVDLWSATPLVVGLTGAV
jgi:alpha-tubulin suppressor-like RCC1 family protein